MSPALTTPAAFIDHWSKAEANERANSQSFLLGLTQLLGVPPPSHNHADGYSFEYPVKVPGGQSTNFLDLYRRAHFVLESKQFTAQKLEQSALQTAALQAGTLVSAKKSGPMRGTGSWDDAMIRAKGQAERYVRSLPAEEPNPPFILVCDVGHSIELYADFTQAGKAYLPFPDPRTFRIQLKDLEREDIRERLRLIWTNPAALDPAKVSAEVTREIAGYLAELAKSLEQEKHDPEVVAQFLTRCLFCMFAEDVGLIPDHAFTELLNRVPNDGIGFPELLSTLFREMNKGTGKTISVVLYKKLLKFNGGLFADDTVLPVNGLQLGLIKQAASKQWKNVEPAIFGTLLERALVPEERHALGAHFTPRAYVERLVLPTVIEPLREAWENVRAAAITHANKGDLKKARQEINAFHDQLCRLRVLDPACGSGNFLYVALQQMKILEGEVLDFAAQFGEDMKLELETHTIDPHQFLGIELNPRAASIAELVLWIGYLQWHFKIHGQRTPPEPILRAFKNIECRDAVLAYDGEPEPDRDADGNVVTVWDRRSYKADLVTNRDVPDETKRVPLLTYVNPRPAEWPEADFIVGNPPFVANRRMRADLGDGYVDAVSSAFPDIGQAVDLVMYFWKHAAHEVCSGKAQGAGLVTTSRIRLPQNNVVVLEALKAGAKLTFAIPDHPWGTDRGDAEVRVAMTSVSLSDSNREPLMLIAPNHDKVAVGQDNIKGEIDIGSFAEIRGREIPSDLSPQADISDLVELNAWSSLSHTGMKPYAETLIISEELADELLPDPDHFAKHARPYRNGQDIARTPRGVRVLDFFGCSEDDIRSQCPAAYQYLLTHTKRERSQERNPRLRDEWWLFEANRAELRAAVSNLERFIVTVENSPNRYFTFVTSDVLPDQKLRVIASDDAFVLGVLSTRIHEIHAMRAGGRHGVRNTPVYNTRCLITFPFPLCGEAEKARIRAVAEELDAHRKRVQAQHPGLTLTGMYNVLEKLRSTVVPPLGGALESPEPAQAGTTMAQPSALTDKERLIHDQGLVSLLQQLHDDLDAAVFAAYGWPATLTDAEILERLVTLNAQRAEEEKRGIIHWLRPEYQNAAGKKTETQDTLELKSKQGQEVKGQGVKKVGAKTPWPKPLAERIRATEQALHAAGHAVTAEELTTQFSRAKTADLQEILESLVTLGRARQDGDKFEV